MNLQTRKNNNNWAMYLGPAAAAVMWISLAAAGLEKSACWAAAVTTWCAVWWTLEPIPIPATSILPFAIFPLVGVMDYRQVALGYGHHLILLFIGGFMIAQALQKSGAHRRLAIGMVRAVGGRGGRSIVLGFMIASAVLSMWITNTATAIMLLPVAMAVLEEMDDKKLAVPLLLGIAYAASIGGNGTPVGSPPNLIFIAAYSEATGREISFMSWMKLALPVVLVMLPIIWLWLTRGMGKSKPAKLPVLGPWRIEEKRVMIAFTATALAWMLRSEPFGGWSGLIGATGAGDSTVALVAVMAMLLCPNGHGGRLLDWKTASSIPWPLLLLLGGGLTIARGFGTSGLSTAIGNALAGISNWPVLAMMAVLTISVGFLTNVVTNTALAVLLMPVLAAAGTAAGIEPALLMVPAVISTSCAFMLPVGTMTNAIIYGTGRITVRTMVKEGFAINLIGAAVIALIYYFLLPMLMSY